jgi:hypothetical protein
MRVAIKYGLDPELGLLVPVEMKQVVDLGALAEQAPPLRGRVDTTVRYSEFRRLTASGRHRAGWRRVGLG